MLKSSHDQRLVCIALPEFQAEYHKVTSYVSGHMINVLLQYQSLHTGGSLQSSSMVHIPSKGYSGSEF